MDQFAEIKELDGGVAYFKFLQGATGQTFQNIFTEFQNLVSKPNVTKMIVDVEMKDAWGKDIQEVWLQTGSAADAAGIKRWGVVTAETSKTMTISFLIKGGKERNRSYETYVGSSLDDVVAWIHS